MYPWCVINFVDIWNVPKVSGSAPEPCSECTLTSVGQNRAVLLGGIKQGWKCVHTLDTKILDMSDWVTIVLCKISCDVAVL